MSKGKKIDGKYITCLVFCFGAGFLSAAYGHHLIYDNAEAKNLIVTVFSILAGFLITIVTLLGDQSTVPGVWRIAEKSRTKIKNKLIRQKVLFYLYLITLLLILASNLVHERYADLNYWIEKTYFFFAVSAFLISFMLPGLLMEVQLSRVDAVIESRRDEASINEKN